MKITKGIQARAVKVLVYGTEGIGKSTFASKFPEPLFLDLEGGTHYLDVSRTDSISSWTELLETVAEAVAQRVCRTLVIDTADWAERLAIRHVCDKYQKSGIEEFGYGSGYTYLTEEFAKFLKYLDRAISHGVNVVILAESSGGEYRFVVDGKPPAKSCGAFGQGEQPNDLAAIDARLRDFFWGGDGD